MKHKDIQKYILLLLFMVTAQLALAQPFTLQGKVSNREGSPIELTSVMTVTQEKLSMTNLKDEFNMRLQSEDPARVCFPMIGYKTKTRILVRPKGKQTLLIRLADDNVLEEIVVQGKAKQRGTTEELDVQKIKQRPSTSGNAVEEVVQTQAGVSTHSELSSQYNVRGSTFDESSVYVNSIEASRPFLVRSGQQEGLSIINPDMVENVGFSTGGFEAEYDDKMSSALDITYKCPKKTKAFVSISLLGASAYLRLATKKLTQASGVRYKTNHYLFGSLQAKGEHHPSFLDYQIYLSRQPNRRWQIDLIGDISDSRYNFKPENRETNFGTLQNMKKFRIYLDGREKNLFRIFFGSLAITRHLSSRTDLSLLASAFTTKEQECCDIQGQYWLTQTETSENLGMGMYMQHSRDCLNADVKSLKLMVQHWADKHRIGSAVTYKLEHIKEDSAKYEYGDSAGYNIPNTGHDLKMIYSFRARNELKAKRFESYLQDTWGFQTRDTVPILFTLSYGVRFAHWDFNGESLFSPRTPLTITPSRSRNLSFRIAGGIYYQASFYKELRDASVVNGVTYATFNREIRAQQSTHALAGMTYRSEMSGRPFESTTEAYYKALSHLVPCSVGNVKVTYYGEDTATGHATGLDLKLLGEFVPGADSWLTLSMMNTSMRLDGKRIPLPADQRYTLNLYLMDFFPGTTRWRMSLKLTYIDGLPFSAPHQELKNNTFRAPVCKHANIGMSYRLLDNNDGHRSTIFKNTWLDLSCLNLFGINNVNSCYWVADVTGQQYATPNYLAERRINGGVMVEF